MSFWKKKKQEETQEEVKVEKEYTGTITLYSKYNTKDNLVLKGNFGGSSLTFITSNIGKDRIWHRGSSINHTESVNLKNFTYAYIDVEEIKTTELSND